MYSPGTAATPSWYCVCSCCRLQRGATSTTHQQHGVCHAEWIGRSQRYKHRAARSSQVPFVYVSTLSMRQCTSPGLALGVNTPSAHPPMYKCWHIPRRVCASRALYRTAKTGCREHLTCGNAAPANTHATHGRYLPLTSLGRGAVQEEHDVTGEAIHHLLASCKPYSTRDLSMVT